jgi:hypothetical protein
LLEGVECTIDARSEAFISLGSSIISQTRSQKNIHPIIGLECISCA